jgi:hypothetical protein
MSDLSEVLKSINSKTNISDELKDGYPFIANRLMSYHRDCVLLANEVNRSNFSPRMQYEFLYNAVSKGYRYKQLHKLEEAYLEDLTAISKYYTISLNQAKEVYPRLSKKELDKIKKHLDIGGKV